MLNFTEVFWPNHTPYIASIKEVKINNRPILGRVFACIQLCSNRRIAGYVLRIYYYSADNEQKDLQGWVIICFQMP